MTKILLATITSLVIMSLLAGEAFGHIRTLESLGAELHDDEVWVFLRNNTSQEIENICYTYELNESSSTSECKEVRIHPLGQAIVRVPSRGTTELLSMNFEIGDIQFSNSESGYIYIPAQ